MKNRLYLFIAIMRGEVLWTKIALCFTKYFHGLDQTSHSWGTSWLYSVHHIYSCAHGWRAEKEVVLIYSCSGGQERKGSIIILKGNLVLFPEYWPLEAQVLDTCKDSALWVSSWVLPCLHGPVWFFFGYELEGNGPKTEINVIAHL